jgi:hypothetical protein
MTEDMIRINEKYEKGYELPNWCFVMASSNSPVALYMAAQDRRWFIPMVAEHPKLSNATHVSLLPPSWGTLYALSKLPLATLKARLADGSITPKLERKDVAKLKSHGPDVGDPEPDARMSPIALLKQDNIQLRHEIEDLKEQLNSAEANDGSLFGRNDTVERIVDIIIRTVSEDKAKKIAAAIIKHYKKAEPAMTTSSTRTSATMTKDH